MFYNDQKIAKYMPQKHNIDLENKNFKIVSSQIKSYKYNLMQILSHKKHGKLPAGNLVCSTCAKTQAEMFKISITMTGFYEKC